MATHQHGTKGPELSRGTPDTGGARRVTASRLDEDVFDKQFEDYYEKVSRQADLKLDVHLINEKGRWRGILMLFQSSSHYDSEDEGLSGSGDSSMMLCVKCGAFISHQQIVQNVCCCVECNTVGAVGREFADHIEFNFDSPKAVARLIHENFLVRAKFNIDLYLRRHKVSLAAAIREMRTNGATAKYKKMVVKARQNREPVIYERPKLERDLCSGADPITTLAGFLKA